MLKPVNMVLTEYYNALQPFLISNGKIEVGDMVCEQLTTGQWLPMTIHTLNDIDVNTQKKIIATSDELGYIAYGELSTDEFNTELRLIDLKDIDDILNSGGKCWIEMDEYLGDYCGYRVIKYKDKKVIIHLKDE
jgi:hypothetical protein